MHKVRLSKDAVPEKIIQRDVKKHCCNCEHHLNYYDKDLKQLQCMCCNPKVDNDDFHDGDCLKVTDKKVKVCIGWKLKIEND
ncbi:hypothetical protein [Clostridium sp. YIM B02500]|uniref:hypothetical protein n=1 Tax=Clostridium sp. YIM B02500 TaxID=2910681 RepID=UPI001EEEFDC8|nr:hypothetical protein [Clostridium sp. YIM B02500]